MNKLTHSSLEVKGAAPLCNLSVWEPRFGEFTWGWKARLGLVKGRGRTSVHPIPLRCEKTSACFSVLGVAGLSLGRTSYPNLAYGPPK